MRAHLGKNPVRGGRPSRERRIREVMFRMLSNLFPISDMKVIDTNE